jgi:hypothetical protein
MGEAGRVLIVICGRPIYEQLMVRRNRGSVLKVGLCLADRLIVLRLDREYTTPMATHYGEQTSANISI